MQDFVEQVRAARLRQQALLDNLEMQSHARQARGLAAAGLVIARDREHFPVPFLSSDARTSNILRPDTAQTALDQPRAI